MSNEQLPVMTPAEYDGAVASTERMNTVGQLLLGGLGAGALIRGSQGLYHLLTRDSEEEKRRNMASSVKVKIPYLLPKDTTAKAADDRSILNYIGNVGSNIWDAGTQLVSPLFERGKKWVDTGISGRSPERSMLADPFAATLAVGAGAGGLYAGWSALDKLFDSRHKNRTKQELDQAREDYENTLRHTLLESKQAEESDEVSTALDKLFDKLASVRSTQPGLDSFAWGNLSPIILLSALATAGAGYGAYNFSKSRRESSLLEKARQRRQSDMHTNRPMPLFAYPDPIHEEEDKKEVVA